MKIILMVALILSVSCASARDCIMYVGAHPDEFVNEVGVACLLSNRYDNVVVTLTHGERGRPDWGIESARDCPLCIGQRAWDRGAAIVKAEFSHLRMDVWNAVERPEEVVE